MVDLKQTLKSFINQSNIKIEENELELTEKYYCELKGIKTPVIQTIPTFYHPVPSQEDTLFYNVREQSRAIFLELKNNELLNSEEVDNIWKLLEENAEVYENEKSMNYEIFCRIRDSVHPKCRQYFSPSVYAKLSGLTNRIKIDYFFIYLMRKIWLHQTFIGLSLYDSKGNGYFNESDLMNYIMELIPTLHKLSDMPETFYQVYLYTVVRKFFFFLDYNRREIIKLTDILASGFLDDLLELRDENNFIQDQNWFSEQNVRRVYDQFLHLDEDQNGMLSIKELSNYNDGTLTTTFIERLFDTSVTYNGEMDYKTYLEFVLAMENRTEERSLMYFFKIFDIDGNGYLTDFTIYYFYKYIQEQFALEGCTPISVDDVSNELFDMLSVSMSRKITLKDLVASGQGGVFFSVLIDINDFWRFDNREIINADEESDYINDETI